MSENPTLPTPPQGELQPVDEVPNASSLLNAKIVGIDNAGATKLFKVSDIKGDYKGIATELTNPGVAVLAQYYKAKPGTYTHFLDAADDPIVIPDDVDGKKVISAYLSFDGETWSAYYEPVEIDLVDYSRKVELTKTFADTSNGEDMPIFLKVFLELLLINGDPERFYTIASSARNAGGNWTIRIFENVTTDIGGVEVCRFTTPINPEGDNKPILIPEFGGSGISAILVIDWSYLTPGVYYDSKWYLEYGLSKDIHNAINYPLISSSLIYNSLFDKQTNEIIGAYVPKDQYIHPDAEYIGDSTRGDFLGVGIITRVDKDVVFNQVKVKIWGAFNTNCEIRICKSKYPDETPNTNTLLYSKIFQTGEFNRVENGFATLILPTPVKATLGDFITVFCVTTSGKNLNWRYWDIDTSSPSRKHFYVINDPNDIWNADWVLSSEGNFSIPAKLLLDLSESKKQDVVPHLLLPKKIKVAEGRELNIWKDALTLLPDGDRSFHISLTPSVNLGYDMDRSFRLAAGNGDAGLTLNLNATIKKQNLENIEERNVTIDVVSKTAGSGTKNILFIGDSLTAHDNVVSEVYNLFNADGGGAVNFIGNRWEMGDGSNWRNQAVGGWSWSNYTGTGSSAYKFVVTGLVVKPDFVSVYEISGNGWYVLHEMDIDGSGNGTLTMLQVKDGTTPTASGILTKIGGTGDNLINFSAFTVVPGNPFYNTSNSRVDFVNYMTRNGFPGNIDIICAQLGINDMFGPLKTDYDILTVFNRCKAFIDQFIEDYPDGTFVLALCPCGAVRDAFGRTRGFIKLEEFKSNIFRLNQMYLDYFDENPDYPNVVISPNILWLDRTYGYDIANVPVSARHTAHSLDLPQSDVHPDQSGYDQIADSYYSTIRSVL